MHVKDDNLFFFATEGCNISNISINDIRKWHIQNCEFNNNQSIYKRTARYDLVYIFILLKMFSNTTPTIQVNVNKIKLIPDKYNEYKSKN